jgi:hypothetical protein
MSDVVDQLVTAKNAHDRDALMRCFSADAVLVPPQGVAQGVEEIASFYTVIMGAFPDLHLEVWEKITQGDHVACGIWEEGTHTGPFLLPGGDMLQPTGRRVGVRAAWMFTLENGLIVGLRI